MWQALHAELEPLGATVVTVALDTDIEAARPFHDAAAPTHPALVDPALTLVDAFGITNVPFGVWIDETGTLVRPAEPAFAPADLSDPAAPRQVDLSRVPAEHRDVYGAILDRIGEPGRYVIAVRDWVANGADSAYVLGPDEVIARSRPRPPDHALAAAYFDLAQHLYRRGEPDAARPHFDRARELDPDNWSYVRQALSLDDVEPGFPSHVEVLRGVADTGAQSFYPELDM